MQRESYNGEITNPFFRPEAVWAHHTIYVPEPKFVNPDLTFVKSKPIKKI